MRIEGRDSLIFNQNGLRHEMKKGLVWILVSMMIFTCWLGSLNMYSEVEAEPVVKDEGHEGSWDDTFNDTSGIYDMNQVAVNES